MKILLVNPSSAEIYGKLKSPIQMPLGLAYIAAVIEKAGFEVQVLDIEANKLTESGFKNKLADYNPAIVGITCTTPVYPSALRICDIVKEFSKEIKTVLGGIHPTVAPEPAVSPENVDFVVFGEGEQTVVELLNSLQKGKSLSDIPGMAYKNSGNPVLNRPRELINDLDSIPFPARHLFKTQDYTYPDSLSKKAFPIVTSRGCPGRCTFCNTQNIFGKKFRARSARNVVDEISMLIDQYGAKEIHIWDDNFTTTRERVFEINDEIKKRNIKVKFAFPNGLRADFLNYEVLEALKQMGVYSIAIGVESGVQEVLNNVNKGIKLEKIVEIFKMLKKLKFETWAFFLIGLPGDTESTVRKTIEFAKTLDPDIAKFHVLKPFPGTQVYKDFKEKNLIISDDLKNFGIHTDPVHNLEALNAKDMARLQKYAYRMFYFRLSKIVQQILRLKSWNRVKLNILAAINVIRTNLSFKL